MAKYKLKYSDKIAEIKSLKKVNRMKKKKS